MCWPNMYIFQAHAVMNNIILPPCVLYLLHQGKEDTRAQLLPCESKMKAILKFRQSGMNCSIYF